MTILKVTNKTEVAKLAGAIAGFVKDCDDDLSVQAIGPLAVNQAVKGIALATKYLAGDGIQVYTSPQVLRVELDLVTPGPYGSPPIMATRFPIIAVPMAQVFEIETWNGQELKPEFDLERSWQNQKPRKAETI